MQNIYIIVLNWNNYNDSKILISQLLQLNYKTFKIVLVDNDSIDKSGERLSHEFSDIDYIQTGSNLGYAAGNNIGMKHAIKNQADYIWILNNDVSITNKSIIKNLLDSYNKLPSIGFLGCKIIDRDKNTIQFLKAKIGDSGFPEHLYAGQKDVNLDYKEIEETDYVQGASMFFQTKLIEDIGLMDDDYFLYYEETDWCLEAKDKGYTHYTLTSEEILHGSPDDKIHMYYYMYRNYIHFSRKFNIKIPILTHTIHVFKEIIKRCYSNKIGSWKKAYAIFIGTAHGIIGRRGK